MSWKSGYRFSEKALLRECPEMHPHKSKPHPIHSNRDALRTLPPVRVPTKLIHSACPSTGVARGLVPRVSLRDALCQPKRDRRDKPGDDTACVALVGAISSLDRPLAASLSDRRRAASPECRAA